MYAAQDGATGAIVQYRRNVLEVSMRYLYGSERRVLSELTGESE
jgi:hypothetical protein